MIFSPIKTKRLYLFIFLTQLLWAREIPDPYRWLEEENSPRVHEWVSRQDKKAEAYFVQNPPQEKWTTRLKELYYADSVSLPKEAGRRLFYKRTLKTREQPVFYWRAVSDSAADAEHLWLDPSLIENHTTVGEWVPSPDGQDVVYALHAQGADEAILHVRDVAKNIDMPKEVIPGANFASVSWAADSRGFWYMRLPMEPTIAPAERVAHADIRFHRIGTPPESDAPIYPATKDASRYLTPEASEDGQWLFVEEARGWASNDIYYSRVGNPETLPVFKPFFISTTSVASVTAWRDRFYLFTNQGASNGKVMRRKPQEEAWETIVPERHDSVIESLHIVGGYLVLVVLINAADRVEVYRPEGQRVWNVPLPEQGKVWGVSGQEGQDDLYIEYESFFVPTCIFRANLAARKLEVWETSDIKVDASKFKTELVWFPSKDGTKISMRVVEPINLTKNGTAPLLLEGYGGFNTPILPRFSEEVLAWLEMGGVYAAPHLRGGGEYGEAWHQAGMLTHKQNTFDDFIAAAEFLIKEGYSRSDRLAIQGVSNGGLLVTAALTQRPDLFRAVVCKNPLTDMIRYPLFGEGKAWVPEYGSPDNENEFKALFAYSPYHHVTQFAYPSVLMFAGEHDDRVDPMHARKFIAALQTANQSKNPILFHLLPHSGHAGSDRLNDQVLETAQRLDFLRHELGMDKQQ